jgi:hypothetical protein
MEPRSYRTYYTDGSRKDGMTCMGIFGPSVRYYETLGTSTTIFQAKMYAINVCARICPNTEGLAGNHVYIMSDSQAALRALKSNTFTSKLVAVCLDNLKRLTTFSDLPTDSVAKRFMSYSNKRTKQILNLSKTEIKTLTEHCGLRYHMHRIGKGLEDTSRICMEQSETTQHVMCECPAVAWIRLERFGKGFMNPKTVKSLKLKSILGFLKAVRLRKSSNLGYSHKYLVRSK